MLLEDRKKLTSFFNKPISVGTLPLKRLLASCNVESDGANWPIVDGIVPDERVLAQNSAKRSSGRGASEDSTLTVT
jgi:hypothetical protein